MKVIIVLIVGLVLGAAALFAFQDPQAIFSGLRTGLTKAEQTLVQNCREDYISDTRCYETKTQAQCAQGMDDRCGSVDGKIKAEAKP